MKMFASERQLVLDILLWRIGGFVHDSRLRVWHELRETKTP